MDKGTCFVIQVHDTDVYKRFIFTALKTPPAYFEQSKQLERAKTGDLLKAKIQRRPDRQELERRHILEQVGFVTFIIVTIYFSEIKVKFQCLVLVYQVSEEAFNRN